MAFPSNAASSSCVTPDWRYEVFLSFYGGDHSSRNFTHYLYTALTQKGILTFIDELQEEEYSKSQSILTAIAQSKCVILVLSRNYANSTWCLDQAAKAVECSKVVRQTIFPVFYDVEPSEVRKQTGYFGNAFSRHEEAFKDNIEKVWRWRATLSEVANLSGWYLQDRYESKVIQEIVEGILSKLYPTISSLSMGLVGIDDRVEEILALLQIGLHDVRTIGIWGMVGIGKSTLARVVFQRIHAKFEGCCFLSDVREETRKLNGLIHLQKQLLSHILLTTVKISSIDKGRSVLRQRLRNKKVLIILDDVDKLEEVETLCHQSWLGDGSRIIITSRNEHVLRTFGVDSTYKVHVLSDDEALQLFSLRAFKNVQVGEEYVELSKNVLKYASGLPLALKVLGSLLYGRTIEDWLATLGKLRRSRPDPKISRIITISFDGLHHTEQKVFLDIACFFKGENKDRVTRILESRCGYSLYLDIAVLEEKSLVTTSGGKLWMHDVIQEVAREIVLRECPSNPGKRSRLWLPENIIKVLQHNMGTDKLEGMALDFPKLEEANAIFDSESFSRMHRLWFLQIRNVHVTEAECPKYLPNSLTFLEWSGYPAKSLPPSFQPEKLCELKLCYSSIEQLWSERKCFNELEFLDVSYSQKLTRIPDLIGSPNLQSLVLEGCTNLMEIDPSIFVLKRLKFLNLKDCRSLRSLPEKFEMDYLETLIISGCSNIKKIPEFVEPMERLLELSLDETAIRTVASSIGCLTGLTFLTLRDCKDLKCLPSDIGKLKSLRRLNICGCSKLENLPESLGKIDCLQEIDAGGTSISDLPSSISLLKNLKVLSLRGCKWVPRKRTIDLMGLHSLTELNLSDCNLQEGTISANLGCLSSLVSLNLSKNNFVSLPRSIRQLSELQNLNLESCKSLQKLPELSEKAYFRVRDGTSLSSRFNLNNCFQLVDNQGSNKIAFAMLRRFFQGIPCPGSKFEMIIPGSEISQWFRDQTSGPVINMHLPRDWYENKWIGYALCAAVVIRRKHSIPAKQLGKWKYGTHSSAHGLRCEVKPKDSAVLGGGPSLGCSEELGHIESDHLWLCFVGDEYFPRAWRDSCPELEFLFRIFGTGLEVKKCAVRLIYEQDLVGI